MDSGWGSLMEGVAGGISGGSQAFFEGQTRRKEAQAKMQEQIAAKAERIAKRAYEIATDSNAPKAVRKQAWTTWGRINKEQDTGIQAQEISDDMWDDSKLNKYLKKGRAIMSNKNYDLQTQIQMIKELETEAQMELGGTLGQQLAPMQKELQDQAFAKGIGSLTKGKIDPETRQLLAGTEEGKKALLQHTKPAPPAKQPSINMYIDKHMGDGKYQIHKWSPATKGHDIPFGEIREEKAKVVYRELEGNIYKITGDKSTVVQKGSLEAKAIFNAMREPQWNFLSPVEQYALVQKHMKFLTGEFGKQEGNKDKYGKTIQRKKNETVKQYLQRVGR